MSKRKIKYNKLWESEFNLIQVCPGDHYSISCKLCQKTFSVSGSGAGQVRSHTISKLHTSRLKEREGKLKFSKDKDGILELKAAKISYTVEVEILKAKIIHSLKCVESNYSFALTNGDGKVFEAMFPDSKIAKG